MTGFTPEQQKWISDYLDSRLRTTRHASWDHLDRGLLVQKIKPSATADDVIASDGTDTAWTSLSALGLLTTAVAATTYLKLDGSNDPMTGDLEIRNASAVGAALVTGASQGELQLGVGGTKKFTFSATGTTMQLYNEVGSLAVWLYTNGANLDFFPAGTASNTLLKSAGQTVWHAGNDGAGSGLDADLLDGQHGSYYSDADNVTVDALGSSVPASASVQQALIQIQQQVDDLQDQVDTLDNTTRYITQVKRVAFAVTAGTGNKVYAGVGFRPKLILFQNSYADGAYIITGVGGTDGSTHWAQASTYQAGNAYTRTISTGCVYTITSAGATACLASFVSFDADGFTLNFTTVDTSTQFAAFCFG